jgi:hypothetical protein
MGTAASSLFAVVDLPQMTHHWFQLTRGAAAGDCADLLGISPGLDAVTWRQYNISSGTQSIHVTAAAGDRVVGTLPNHPNCSNPALIASSAYSPSGQYLFVLDRELGTTSSSASDPAFGALVVIDGSRVRLELTPPPGGWARGAEPSMPVWSPVSDTLYYQQNGQIWSWTPAGGARQFLSGVSWCYPALSADGKYLTYGALRPDGLYDVDLVDLTSGQAPHVIGNGRRNMPAFLNSSLLWYEAWSYSNQCGGGGDAFSPKFVGQPLIYDTTDGSEVPSQVDQVFEVWPATGYGYNGVWPAATVGH